MADDDIYCPHCDEMVPRVQWAVHMRDRDMQMFGVGFTREHPDGRIEYVSPEQVYIEPESAALQSSSKGGVKI